MSGKSTNYERVEITFSKVDDIDKEIFKYLNEKSKIVGKAKYLKQLLYDKMVADKGLNK
ncbi:hypothetical protein [Clostridium felsineum]|uniref:Uncharacterized protein n=1 Tax=Clostridium felsineum TaxID=36839 RepID=A0A1S8KZP8_9CLOT|nr:hypothetical protein [Clostridium felsineum]URZ06511.1 hypothetical protein CLROS_018440 [Clostridium felsineum]URZ11546.1 hypothetical protein CROST_022630 [Clostridium felsineum]